MLAGDGAALGAGTGPCTKQPEPGLAQGPSSRRGGQQPSRSAAPNNAESGRRHPSSQKPTCNCAPPKTYYWQPTVAGSLAGTINGRRARAGSVLCVACGALPTRRATGDSSGFPEKRPRVRGPRSSRCAVRGQLCVGRRPVPRGANGDPDQEAAMTDAPPPAPKPSTSPFLHPLPGAALSPFAVTGAPPVLSPAGAASASHSSGRLPRVSKRDQFREIPPHSWLLRAFRVSRYCTASKALSASTEIRGYFPESLSV